MNKFIYLFAILGSLALATAQIAEPDVSNTAADDAQEPGILTPFEDSLPVDGDSDYFKNGEDYGGIYEGYFEDAEGFVSTADDVNDDLGYTEEPIVSEEFAGLVDVPEPLNEEDATIGEAVVEPSEDPFQFNHIPNSALDSDVGEDFYGSWEAIADSPDDIISEEGFVSLPDALIQFEEEAAVDVPEALVGLEEAKTADIQSGEADYPDDLTEAEEDNFSEAFVDYPDNLVESGEVVSEALVDYPDDLVESEEEEEEDSSQGIVDYPDDLFESEEVTVDIPEAYVGEPEDITDAGEADEPEDITDAGEADEPEDITDAGEVGEPEDITDAGEADEPEDITDAGEADEPEDITDAGEVDEPEDPKEDDAVVELDPRVLDTNEEESPVASSDGQGYAVQLDNVEQAEEKSKNFLG